MRRLHAYALLGWHFLLHWLKKLFFVYRRGGIERVRDNFEKEGIIELGDAERDLLAQWQSCIGCGLCEAVCPDLHTIVEQRQVGPSLLAQAHVRDLSNADLSLPAADVVSDCDRGHLQTICPVDIPLADLTDFLIRVGEKTEAARRTDA